MDFEQFFTSAQLMNEIAYWEKQAVTSDNPERANTLAAHYRRLLEARRAKVAEIEKQHSNVNINLTMTVHEWRVLSAAAFIASKMKNGFIRDDDRKMAHDLAHKIVAETGKYPR